MFNGGVRQRQTKEEGSGRLIESSKDMAMAAESYPGATTAQRPGQDQATSSTPQMRSWRGGRGSPPDCHDGS